jgi:hypothetical protein
MKLWPVSANFFREDDTFVAAFAFVHLRERVAGRQSPGHTHRISFSRGAHEAGAWGTGAFTSAGSLFSCQVCGRPRLRAIGTIRELFSDVKFVGRDLLDKRLPVSYSRADDREGCCLGGLPGSADCEGCGERSFLLCLRNGFSPASFFCCRFTCRFCRTFVECEKCV